MWLCVGCESLCECGCVFVIKGVCKVESVCLWLCGCSRSWVQEEKRFPSSIHHLTFFPVRSAWGVLEPYHHWGGSVNVTRTSTMSTVWFNRWKSWIQTWWLFRVVFRWHFRRELFFMPGRQANMPARHVNTNFRIFHQLPLYDTSLVPPTIQFFFAHQIHFNQGFCLPKFSSITCLKQQLQVAGHIDPPPVSSTSKKPNGGRVKNLI